MPKWGSGGGLHLVFLVLDSICPSTVAFKCPAFIKVKKYAAKVDLFSTVASMLGLLFPCMDIFRSGGKQKRKTKQGKGIPSTS